MGSVKGAASSPLPAEMPPSSMTQREAVKSLSPLLRGNRRLLVSIRTSPFARGTSGASSRVA